MQIRFHLRFYLQNAGHAGMLGNRADGRDVVSLLRLLPLLGTSVLEPNFHLKGVEDEFQVLVGNS